VNVIEASAAGKRYGRTWALRDCSLSIPAGRVVALVGPNGAGKSTLLNLAVGLTTPTAGHVTVLGGRRPGSAEALEGIAFVAQDTPLYPTLSVADTVRLVDSLNRQFDAADARRRLQTLGIPLTRKVGKLSGGQLSQVALAVALARHPQLLILDEPVARLDPLARHEFMATLMESVAEEGLSVLLSSHVVAELERVCDHLVLLSAGQVQLMGDVDEVLAQHGVLIGPAAQADTVAAQHCIVRDSRTDKVATMLARLDRSRPLPPDWQVGPTNLEEVVLGYLRSPNVVALPGPSGVHAGEGNRSAEAWSA
jgi:ABC-2 type transport system ATP-binding protein